MKSELSDYEREEILDHLLALFLANDAAPIVGRIMLVKQAFLIAKEVTLSLARPMKFFPYLYGPYSNVLAELVNTLIDEGYVKSYKESGDYFYQLTEEGIQWAAEQTSDLAKSAKEKISQLKRNTQELGLSNVLKMVYREYPEYAVYSRGREAYGTT